MTTRRTFLAGSVASLAHLGCGGARSTATAPPPRMATPPAPEKKKREPRSVEVLDWTFPSEFGGPKRASILVPRPIPDGTKHRGILYLAGDTSSKILHEVANQGNPSDDALVRQVRDGRRRRGE